MSSNSNNNKKSPYPNPLEILRDLGKEAREAPKAITEQLFGMQEKNFSGEITPGESLEIRDVYAGKRETEENLAKQLYLERRLREEDRVLVEKRTGELKIQIQAIHEEIIRIAEVTPDLNQEVEIAAFQAPGDPSSYELYFLERLFEFIKSFRKKIEDASVWLASANRRARRKNVWGTNYKKHGAKYLLSGEHYSSRSAA